MQTELEKTINADGGGNEVKLHGKIKLGVDKSGSFTVGKLCVKGIITVTRPGVVIDGSDAEIEVDINDCTTSDWSLFFIHPAARNVRFRNLSVKVRINNPVHSARIFAVIYNTSYGLSIEGCRIEAISDKQLNMAGVYNNGNLDTHLDTRADNAVIANNTLKIECMPDIFDKECAVYGIYNYLANSISVQNNFIYAVNKGDGGRQKAAGVYTNGRFGRFTGNNIKANCTHNKGFEIEHAHAFGFINDGLYSLIECNNIVGEWAGMSVGLENSGEYALIEGNKILATHTMRGRSIRNYASKCAIRGNVITSTSRNARLIELAASDCVISGNVMEVLMAQSECRSGCGIYAAGENCARNIISENMIRYVADCGIFADKPAGEIINNSIVSYGETIAQAGTDNKYLLDKLDERHIRSRTETGVLT